MVLIISIVSWIFNIDRPLVPSRTLGSDHLIEGLVRAVNSKYIEEKKNEEISTLVCVNLTHSSDKKSLSLYVKLYPSTSPVLAKTPDPVQTVKHQVASSMRDLMRIMFAEFSLKSVCPTPTYDFTRARQYNKTSGS